MFSSGSVFYASDTAYLPFPGRMTEWVFMSQRPAPEPRRLQRNLYLLLPRKSLFFLWYVLWVECVCSENNQELNLSSLKKYNRIQNSVCFLTKQEDYIETDDKKIFPLRWTAPELVTSFQDRLLTADQTKYSNIWYVLIYHSIKLLCGKALTSFSLSTFFRE